jgi:rare lipoprotein A
MVQARSARTRAVTGPGALRGLARLALAAMVSGCAAAGPAQLVDRDPAPSTPEIAEGPQVGVASWYGRWHHRRRSASGERFDQNALTAAHRTLPFGTWVRVTNLANGRQVTVRITDRGPYWPQRVIDLSREAARVLGMVESGVSPVRLEIVGPGRAAR